MAWSFFTKEGVEKIGEFGIVGVTGGDADTLDGLDSSMYWKKSETIAADTLEGYGAADFVKIVGDTLTGALILSGPPTGANEATTKAYVDSADALKLNLTGGTLTGPLYLPVADPTVATQAAHKSYVDFQINATVAVAGDTMTGALTLSGAPTAPLHAATKSYVDTAVTGATNTAVQKTGSTMSGFLILNADPTLDSHASTKKYVDDTVAFALAATSIFPIFSTAVSLTLDPTDTYVSVDSTGGARTITLPTATPAGKIFCIKDGAGLSATNNISVVGEAGETIDGAATYLLDTPYEWVMVISDGTNWLVVS